MSNLVINITIGNWYLVRGEPTKITPANVVWAFRDGCSPMPLTDDILESHGWWHDEQHQLQDAMRLAMADKVIEL